jgi:hypothetical protein
LAKISALTDGSTPTGSTDVFPIARSGANRKLSVGSFPIVLAKWGVPVILASSGTMGNNGAVSAMTALPITYSGGAWLYLPANAIQAGSAAGFYWFVASSTTAGTVYNSTFDGTSVPGAGTATAFVSTGPGAFAGIAAGEILVATVTIPAGSMGPNGFLELNGEAQNNTAAGNKTFRVDFGGTDLFQVVATTNSAGPVGIHIRNKGLATRQHGTGFTAVGTQVLTSGLSYSSADSANAVSLTFTLEKATATNHATWEGMTVKVVYGA